MREVVVSMCVCVNCCHVCYTHGCEILTVEIGWRVWLILH